MSTSKNRRLAAILFADIVGYTTLMESDELRALAALNKFKDNLMEQVPTSGGEVVQFFGDGCLCAFNSSVDAVICAKTLQATFQKNPKASVAMEILYNPELALEIFDELDISTISPASAGVHYNWRIQNYATCLHLLDRQKELTQFCKESTPNQSAWMVPCYNAILFPAANNQDLEELKKITTAYKTSPSFNPFYYWIRIFGFARKPNNKTAIQSFWQGELDWLVSILNPADTFTKIVQLEVEQLEGRTLSYQPIKDTNNNLLLPFEEACYLPASLAIAEGNSLKAETIISQYLDNLAADTSPISSPYKYGFRFYDIAILYTKMGKEEQALLFLQKAITAGMTLNGTEFTRDSRLQPLFDAPDFNKLIQPIWPDRLQN